MRAFHLVSHTHWDREWYHPAERFRHRLVDLIDGVLDQPPGEGSFLLDGQAVVLEDYLAVRPERADALGTALASGQLQAGPWYVLADELIPSGEALVRNLIAGRRVLRAMGADAPPVLYCPDSFGHPATLPALAAGFGKPMIILWRGFGSARWPAGNLFRWSAPGGEATLMYPLTRSGYELGSSLPSDPTLAAQRWSRIAAEFRGRSTVGVELLLNGADHHALQHQLQPAIAALQQAARPDVVRPSSLTEFSRALGDAAAAARVPDIAGELRDSYGFTWTLQGTLASRTPQKRRYVQQERELLRDVEPWVALAAFRHQRRLAHFTRATWRSLLLCQPHDTLCGCSIDDVARAMDQRLESTSAQATELRDAAIESLLGHDRDVARSRPEEWQPVVVVRNRSARTRSGVALVEVVLKVADVPVGPGSAPKRGRREPLDAFANLDLGYERTEAARAYPDNDAVARFHTAVWVDAVPPMGIVTTPLDATGIASGAPDVPVTVHRRSMTNGRLTLSWDARGRLTLEDTTLGRTIADLIGWESREDLGDLYTPSIRGPKLRPVLKSTTVLARGPLTGVLEQRWRFARASEVVDLRLRIVMDAGAPFLRFGVLGDNAARDHRLRLAVSTDLRRPQVWADAAFGHVERRPVTPSRAERRMESPPGTDPLHRYVSLFEARRGATLFSDGSTEYEAHKGRILVTLVRAVGELSRNDLPERPGHAGWPAATPQAQCIGPFEAEFGFQLHGARDADTIDEIERTADDVLHPLVGSTLRSALRVAPTVTGAELTGRGLGLSSVKQSDDEQWVVVRCVNFADHPSEGSWRLAGIREAKLARLDETPVGDLDVRAGVVHFQAPARGIVTILVR